jgi:FixJ family two-component response regulator
MNEDEDEKDPKNKKKKKQVLNQIAQGDIKEAVAEEIDVEKRHREADAMDGFITNDDHKSGPEF